MIYIDWHNLQIHCRKDEMPFLIHNEPHQTRSGKLPTVLCATMNFALIPTMLNKCASCCDKRTRHHHSGSNISRAYCQKTESPPCGAVKTAQSTANTKGANERPLCKMKANPFHPLLAHLLLFRGGTELAIYLDNNYSSVMFLLLLLLVCLPDQYRGEVYFH